MTNGSFANEGEIRASFRSIFTNASHLTYASSGYIDASETERSSVVTRASSISDSFTRSHQTTHEEEGMSVDDAIAMYAAGFGEDDDPEKAFRDGNTESPADVSPLLTEQSPVRPLDPVSNHGNGRAYDESRAMSDHAVPQSPCLPLSSLDDKSAARSPPSSVSPVFTKPEANIMRSPLHSRPAPPPPPSSSPSAPDPGSTMEPVPRDRYGFKKKTQHVTVEQYDAWNLVYTEYLGRRREKWGRLMKHEGLSMDNPQRFPSRSDKLKRYIRKGIPPAWRGAAWFWYAGGPEQLSKAPGLYWKLVAQTEQGYLSDADREHIERDLHRTFPDNVRFKPDVAVFRDNLLSQTGVAYQQDSPALETPVLCALRRVLQAFAIHNPDIGYCQSLNFLAGLLLLFLDQDEEKAFTLLNIITSKHLPGTHAKVLEANVDIGVLMSCIKESMPAVWVRIDDSHDNPTSSGLSTSRLPTVSLATTSWFMSLFIGTLPVECVLRVWDCFFYEGSKTLFRIALTIFKIGEPEIRSINDPMEIFQVVQQIPRRMINANSLMEACYRRRNGFGHLSQDTVEKRRQERRTALKRDRSQALDGSLGYGRVDAAPTEHRHGGLRAASRARIKRAVSRRRPAE